MGIKEDFQALSPGKSLMGGLLLAIVYYFLFFDKGATADISIAQLRTEKEEISKRLQDVQNAMENKNAFESQAAVITKELEELLKFFPVNANINEFQKEMTTIISKSKLQLKVIQEEEATSRFPGYNEQGIKIQIEGDFHEAMDFLSSLTKMSRMVDFKKMEFSTVPGSPQSEEMIDLVLNLVVFSYDSQTKPTVEKQE